MRKLCVLFGVLFGACLLGGASLACNSGDVTLVGPTLPPIGLNFSPEIAVVPPTVQARRSTDPGFDWEVAFEVSLRDVARRGIRVDVARLAIHEAGGGPVFEGAFEELLGRFDGRVPVGGTSRWALQGIRYSLPDGDEEALGHVYFEMETGVGDFRNMTFTFPIS